MQIAVDFNLQPLLWRQPLPWLLGHQPHPLGIKQRKTNKEKVIMVIIATSIHQTKQNNEKK